MKQPFPNRDVERLWRSVGRYARRRPHFDGSRSQPAAREAITSFVALEFDVSHAVSSTGSRSYAPHIDIDAFDISRARAAFRDASADRKLELIEEGRLETAALTRTLEDCVAGFYAQRPHRESVMITAHVRPVRNHIYLGTVTLQPTLIDEGASPDEAALNAQAEWNDFVDYVRDELAIPRLDSIARGEHQPKAGSQLDLALNKERGLVFS